MRESGDLSTVVAQPDNAEKALSLERQEEEACILLGLNRCSYNSLLCVSGNDSGFRST